MHIGRSTNRLEYSNMLEMEEIRNFSEQVAKQSEIFSVMDESLVSRISVLQNNEQLIDRYIPTCVNTNEKIFSALGTYVTIHFCY